MSHVTPCQQSPQAKQQEILGREDDEDLLQDVEEMEKQEEPQEEPQEAPEALPEQEEDTSEPFDDLAQSMNEAPKEGLVITLPSGSGPFLTFELKNGP